MMQKNLQKKDDNYATNYIYSASDVSKSAKNILFIIYNNMRKILYLFLLTIIFFCIIFNYKEGFKSDYSDYNTIDRIKTANDNEYAYCLAGNVTCSTGKIQNLKDDYKGGQTYSYLCDDKSRVECRGNFQYKMNPSQLDWKTPTSREIPFNFSDTYKGFTVPYSYVPVDINDKYMNFYDKDKNVLDSMNKCNMLLTDDDAYKCIKSTYKKVEPSKESSTKCIANYGTNVGDPLCCGQTGVLQNSAKKYVCPTSSPTCSGYTCGDKYGTCK